ncbi:MAG: hypothetical protein JNJ57_15525 [Saprospiraceae bacterium]|nr:hypothetical protein [Saprospiraceae bacterium]
MPAGNTNGLTGNNAHSLIDRGLGGFGDFADLDFWGFRGFGFFWISRIGFLGISRMRFFGDFADEIFWISWIGFFGILRLWEEFVRKPRMAEIIYKNQKISSRAIKKITKIQIRAIPKSA